MENNGQNTEILNHIWQELKSLHKTFERKLDETNARIDRINERLDQTNERLDQTNERLDQTILRLDQTILRVEETNLRLDETNNRITRLELKLSTEITALASTIDETNKAIKGWGKRLAAVEKKVAHLPG